MKKQFCLLLAAMFLISFGVSAQKEKDIDRSKQPESAPAREIKLGKYESFTLENGLKVYVVQNSKIPRVTIQLTLDRDPIKEGEKAGYVGVAGQMMARGTKNRTKEQLDKEVDFMGATLSAFSTGAYGSALTKHKEKLFELMSDVVLNPTFPEEELEKVRKEGIDGIKSSEQSPDAMIQNLVQVMRYGKDHPFGELETVETMENIKREDLVKYYETYFRPNIGYMAVVGDITMDEAEELVSKYFGDWKKAEVPTHEYEMPGQIKEAQVDMVNKSGAVQSIINITYPVEFKRNSDDYIAASLANGILGNGGFSGRLFQNLREDKGYTYGAYSSLSASDEVGSFTATAKVRTEVTDSAVEQFMYEIERIGKEPVKPEELSLTKSVFSGRFARSLEDPRTMARFAINTALYDLPKDYYETYLQKVEAVSIKDIQEAASKYIRPEAAHIVAVADADKVADKLARFGNVTQYDMYGNVKEEIDEEALTKDMDAEKVIAGYLKAIGGKENVEKVKSVRSTAEMSVQGMSMSMDILRVAPNLEKTVVKLPMGMGTQEQIFDGKKGKVSSPQGTKVPEGEELEGMAMDAYLFLELMYEEAGLTAELKGVEEVKGKKTYKVTYTSANGQTRTRYYDMETMLLTKVENGPVSRTFSEYKEVEGIKFPYASEVLQPGMPGALPVKVTKIEVNTEVDAKEFEIK